jgi:hypothetical protein
MFDSRGQRPKPLASSFPVPLFATCVLPIFLFLSEFVRKWDLESEARLLYSDLDRTDRIGPANSPTVAAFSLSLPPHRLN